MDVHIFNFQPPSELQQCKCRSVSIYFFLQYLNFHARTSRSRLSAGARRTALQVGWSQAESVPVPEPAPNTKLSITHSIFELEVRNFACKQILTARSHFRTKKYKSTKKYISTKVLINQSFFELQTPDFAWKFICTVQPNEKVQKYKNY